ncbi:hypothetical protein BGZ88_010462 [Linnemannia elongata]|nr:hypothetical protein BGZ88_010462 [Linnemannia elongata]
MNQAMVLSSGKAFIETVIYLTSLAFALKSILAAIPFIFIAISSPIIALRARTAVVRVPLAITLLGSATPVTVMTPATFIIPATTRLVRTVFYPVEALEIRQDIQVLFQIQLQKAAIPDLDIVEGPMMKRQSPTY